MVSTRHWSMLLLAVIEHCNFRQFLLANLKLFGHGLLLALLHTIITNITNQNLFIRTKWRRCIIKLTN